MPKGCDQFRDFFRRNRRKKQKEAAESKKEEEKKEKEAPPEEQASSKEETEKENPIEMPSVLVELLEGEMPTYFHVGQMAKLSLIDGYDNGMWKLQTTTKTENELYLSSFGEGYPFVTNAFGGVEALQQMGPYHASLCWLTDQTFLSEIGVRDEAFEGKWLSNLKLALNTAEQLQVSAKFKCGFDRNPIRFELEVPIYRQPFLMGYLMVAPAEDVLLGYRTVFDITVTKFVMHAFCLGYDNKSTEVALKLENFGHLRGSIFQRLGEKWALALKSDLYGNVEQTNFHVGCQYEWEPGTLLKAKIRGDARLGFVYQHTFSENIKALFNFFFDVKNPLHGEIRLGTAWYFNV